MQTYQANRKAASSIEFIGLITLAISVIFAVGYFFNISFPDHYGNAMYKNNGFHRTAKKIYPIYHQLFGVV